MNPGAFDAPGNRIDDDCSGSADDAPSCDAGIASDTSEAGDFARALDLCAVTTASSKQWGLIEAKLTLADGSGTPSAVGHAVRPHFGSGLQPQLGQSLVLLSTGAAAGRDDIRPSFSSSDSNDHGQSSPPPSDFLTAHGGALPTAPDCPPGPADAVHDPEMLILKVRVPVNARSFSLKASLYSYEFPEWVCSAYNDFFVALLTSSWSGAPANPSDKNLAVFKAANDGIYPVGVNLASNNTGLFRQCMNGKIGCSSTQGSISTCIATTELVGTGFDAANADSCDTNSLAGGATGWLTLAGNVAGGEVMMLRLGLWDTGDGTLDSTVALDAFRWSTESVDPGATL